MPGFNPFRYRFPYTNINDINLDWIIKKVKTLSEAVSHIDISRIDEIAEQAETAQQDAETALATAQSAETTANSVQGIANNALTTAQSAETTANSVQGIANNALTTAQSAQTTATQAASDAQSAISIGDNAATVAGLARSEAQSAQTAANALDASKADKVNGATLGNFASLAASGNILDSGFDSGDFAAAAAAVPAGGTTGQVLTKIGATDYAVAWQAPSGGGGDVSADMLGIAITGARPAVAVTIGQYVIVQNSTITGVPDGLYTAVNALSPSTDVTAPDLSAVSDGGLNGVMAADEITSAVSFDENITGTNTHILVKGKQLYVYYQGESKTHSPNTRLFALPSYIAPAFLSYHPCVVNNAAYGNVSLTASGECYLAAISSSTAVGRVYASFSVPLV